jgi:hypothetical protein
MPDILASGYSEADAALIFDLAWQAMTEAQTALARVVNRVPEHLHIATGALASDMLRKAMVSMLYHLEETNTRRMIEEMFRQKKEG